MNLKEVLKTLSEGKKLRLKSWGESEYIVCKDDFIVNKNGKQIYVDLSNNSYSWEEYVERIEWDWKVGDCISLNPFLGKILYVDDVVMFVALSNKIDNGKYQYFYRNSPSSIYIKKRL